MTREQWSAPYDGAPHPDRSLPQDHNDISPVAWRERRFLAAISVEGDNDDED